MKKIYSQEMGSQEMGSNIPAPNPQEREEYNNGGLTDPDVGKYMYEDEEFSNKDWIIAIIDQKLGTMIGDTDPIPYIEYKTEIWRDPEHGGGDGSTFINKLVLDKPEGTVDVLALLDDPTVTKLAEEILDYWIDKANNYDPY